MVSVHDDNVMEFHLTSGTFMQNREVKGRRRLNCCATYCLWITSKQNNSPLREYTQFPRNLFRERARRVCACSRRIHALYHKAPE